VVSILHAAPGGTASQCTFPGKKLLQALKLRP
jgi:hypothetical protein